MIFSQVISYNNDIQLWNGRPWYVWWEYRILGARGVGTSHGDSLCFLWHTVRVGPNLELYRNNQKFMGRGSTPAGMIFDTAV